MTAPKVLKALPDGNRTIRDSAREIGVSAADLSHFLKGRLEKVGAANRRTIRTWLIANGYLAKPAPRPMYCRQCGCIYPTRKNYNDRQS